MKDLKYMVAVSISVFLIGCGGGGSSDSPAANTNNDTLTIDDFDNTDGNESNDENNVVDLSGNLAFYVQLSGGTNTDYFNQYNISVSSSTTYIYKIVPDADVVTEVVNNTSVDYATSYVVPKTENGAFYVVRMTGWENSDKHTLTKMNPLNDETIWQKQFWRKPINGEGHVAIVDNTYYFGTVSSYDYMSGGYIGGDFWKADISGDGFTAESTILAYNKSPNDLSGIIDASETNLYEIIKDEDHLSIYTRDLDTGIQKDLLGSWTITDNINYDSYKFDVDRDGKIYFIRYQSTALIELWQIDLSADPDQIFSLLSTYDLSGSTVSFDVDNGHCMLAENTGGLIYIYDVNTEDKRIIDLGISFRNIEILYID